MFNKSNCYFYGTYYKKYGHFLEFELFKMLLCNT